MITGIHPSIPKNTTWAGMQPEVPKAMTKPRSKHTTLDAAWADARSLGKTSLEENHNQTSHEAKILFRTRAGSTIYAKGEGTTALDALNAALDEALALKAGVIFADKD